MSELLANLDVHPLPGDFYDELHSRPFPASLPLPSRTFQPGTYELETDFESVPYSGLAHRYWRQRTTVVDHL